MGIISYDVDTANKLESTPSPQTSPPPLGELSLDYIKLAKPELFEGLGKLSEPFSITLNPDMKPIQAVPHCYAPPKLPIIKEALDKLIETGQLVQVNEATPLISNMVVRERPASAEFLDLLNCLSPHNLKLNTDKIKFKTPTAPFMGRILTPEGLKPIKEIATAILGMPQPLDKAATCRFLGTVTYVSKFCPNLSVLVCPLRDIHKARFSLV